MEEKILNVLRTALENNALDINVSQTNCVAWDSLHQLDIVLELEDAFDVSIEPEDIVKLVDIPSIKNVLLQLGVED